MADLYEYYNTGDDNFISIGSPANPRAQTFGVSTPHTVTSVKIKMSRVPESTPSTVSVTIQETTNGKPNGDIKSSGSFNGNSLPEELIPSSWVEITFPSPASLLSGHLYALVVASLAAEIRWAVDESSPTYTGGHFCYKNGEDPWYTNSSLDLMFEVYGESTIDYVDMEGSIAMELSLSTSQPKAINPTPGNAAVNVNFMTKTITWELSL